MKSILANHLSDRVEHGDEEITFIIKQTSIQFPTLSVASWDTLGKLLILSVSSVISGWCNCTYLVDLLGKIEKCVSSAGHMACRKIFHKDELLTTFYWCKLMLVLISVLIFIPVKFEWTNLVRLRDLLQKFSREWFFPEAFTEDGMRTAGRNLSGGYWKAQSLRRLSVPGCEGINQKTGECEEMCGSLISDS